MIKVSVPLLKNLSLLSVLVILSLILLENLLRYFTPFPISITSNMVPHGELLHVLDSDLPNIDRLGFRNRKGLRDQTIFAIGDSHTYGANVTWDKSWPMQLQKMLKLEVYNFGVGSYNIYQYYRLFEISTRYDPKYVVIGLYTADDLIFNVCETLRLDFWRNKILELGLTNNYCDRKHREDFHRPNTENKNEQKSNIREIKEFLKWNVALVSAFDYLIWDPIQLYFDSRDENRTDTGTTDKNEDKFFSIVQKSIEIKINKSRVMRQSKWTNLGELRVSEHFANSQILFKQMKRQSERNGIKLMVLIIPSKERIIVRWARKNNVEVPVLLNMAVKNENSIIKKYLNFFSKLSIPASDPTRRMVDLMGKNLSDGTQFYPPRDGHPLEAGYSEYAKSASELFIDLHVRQ